jgi:hypothetical protein
MRGLKGKFYRKTALIAECVPPLRATNCRYYMLAYIASYYGLNFFKF